MADSELAHQGGVLLGHELDTPHGLATLDAEQQVTLVLHFTRSLARTCSADQIMLSIWSAGAAMGLTKQQSEDALAPVIAHAGRAFPKGFM